MIGRWVLETACAAAASWDNQNWVAVNVSPAQFRSGDLAETISSVLARTGLAPHRLEIEVTEGILMEEPKRAADVLSAVRALGVRIAMDDFGTGYSSLSYLHEFKFDKLKIDRSFVKRLGEAQEATSIITAIVGLARQLGLSVVAEGVETTTQLNTLRDLKCDLIQGYLVGRPMQMDAPTELMAARARMFFSGALAGSSVDAGASQNNQQDEANAVAQRTD
jgi:EAL domain-containing protein (putative c-di-GMP-specific phosphodiesterase class I)